MKTLMIPHCIQLRASLEKFKNDSTELLRNPLAVCPEANRNQDKIIQELFADSCDPEIVALTILAMQLILHHW